MGRLRRRLAMAGYTSPTAVIVFALANLVTPVVFGSRADLRRRQQRMAVRAARGGVRLPAAGHVLARKIERRKREIREGLPDALDLFIVCVEAGCGLDQAIVRHPTSSGSHIRRWPTNCA